jgi:hypothetical protein
MSQGLLISSFSDGLLPNQAAHAYLQKGLIRSMLTQKQHETELRIKQSVEYSPCAGPDIQALEHLECIDAALDKLKDDSTTTSPLDVLRHYQKYHCAFRNDNDKNTDDSSLILRFVYVPTAMYALRLDSNNTPGKQRQRARADGKARRNAIVKLLHQLLPPSIVQIHVITLDWDDGSIKQPEGSLEANHFPKNATDAMKTWLPHLVYVQGGNTFWLHYCLHKTPGCKQDLIDFCMAPDTGMYVGSSAGAILIGTDMETACWKGWDDPSVVPNMESYENWKGVKGLGLVGKYSFFPHMDDQWNDLVQAKLTGLSSIPICLGDGEVCLVNGATKSATVLHLSVDAHAMSLD